MVDDLRGAAGEGVGGRLAEDVAHVGAGRDQELTAAHPDLKGLSEGRGKVEKREMRIVV